MTFPVSASPPSRPGLGSGPAGRDSARTVAKRPRKAFRVDAASAKVATSHNGSADMDKGTDGGHGYAAHGQGHGHGGDVEATVAGI